MELPSHYGIMSTVLDMAKWDAALTSEKILKQSSLKLMWTPVKLNNGQTNPYGFGWKLHDQRGHAIVGHSGITGTEITRFVNDSLTVIVLTNLGSWGKATPRIDSTGLTTKVAEFYIPDLAYHAIEDRDPEFTALIRKLFSNPVASAWDETLFAPGLWPVLAASLSSNQESLRALGTLRQIQLVEQKQLGGQRKYVYRLSYDGRSQLLSVTRNQAGKITGILSAGDEPE